MKLDDDRLKRIIKILYALSIFLFLVGLYLYVTDKELVNTSINNSSKTRFNFPQKLNGKGLIILSLLIAIVSAIINYKELKIKRDYNQ